MKTFPIFWHALAEWSLHYSLKILAEVYARGDFHIHVEQENHLRVKTFNSHISDIDLHGHVCFPTHEKGHAHDLALTDVSHPPLIREPGPTLQGFV